MNKIITKKEEMEAYLKDGMEEIASIVARTLGPGGLPIIIERQGQALNGDPLGPMITKDGVSVAVEAGSNNPKKDVIIQAVKAICQKTNRVAGDGTTTAIVLGNALFSKTLEVLQKNDKVLNPQTVKREIDTAVSLVDGLLADAAMECKDLDMIEKVSTISANGDSQIGQIIRQAFAEVGSEGVITVDEGSSREHSITVVDGFQFRRGAEAQDRFFNNREKTKFEADKARVLLYDGKLQNASQVVNSLDLIYRESKNSGQAMPPVVFIASEFTQEVLQTLLIFRAEQGLSVCAVRAPHQTSVSTQILEDLAYFLGGERLGNGNRNLANLEFDDLGLCESVAVDKYTCTLFGGAGEDLDVQERIHQLKAQRENAESPYDAALLSDRIASLAQGIAKIGVGGLTELEVKETYHRIEDAVNAARAAIEGGVIAGGGATLYRIAYDLISRDEFEQSVGMQIVSEALKAPFLQICQNLGIEVDRINTISAKVLAQNSAVYDGITNSVGNFLETGIVDPVKVTRTALENAASIAALLATCGGAVTYERLKQ